jgi:hypothetical protein
MVLSSSESLPWDDLEVEALGGVGEGSNSRGEPVAPPFVDVVVLPFFFGWKSDAADLGITQILLGVREQEELPQHQQHKVRTWPLSFRNSSLCLSPINFFHLSSHSTNNKHVGYVGSLERNYTIIYPLTRAT